MTRNFRSKTAGININQIRLYPRHPKKLNLDGFGDRGGRSVLVSGCPNKGEYMLLKLRDAYRAYMCGILDANDPLLLNDPHVFILSCNISHMSKYQKGASNVPGSNMTNAPTDGTSVSLVGGECICVLETPEEIYEVINE